MSWYQTDTMSGNLTQADTISQQASSSDEFVIAVKRELSALER